MKIIMRPDKTQVKSLYKFNTQSEEGVFYTELPIAVGYTTYDVMCVGGSGGRWLSDGGSTSDDAVWASGGGGGGSIKYVGDLEDLDATVPYGVGNHGRDEEILPIGHNVPPQSGGTSYFGVLEAYGGEANEKGSRFDPIDPGQGGAGGGNSLGLGTTGVGGHGKSSTVFGDPAGTLTNATNGTWEAGAEPGSGGGGGGGGGRGRVKRNGSTWQSSTATAGASGSTTEATGAGGAVSSNTGGDGGGANIDLVTGVDEFYGGQDQGGVVVIKLS